MRTAAPAVHAKPRYTGGIRPYLFLLPMLIFVIGFVYYPFIRTALHSVSVVNFQGTVTGFAGLENFAYLFGRREFLASLQNTLKLAFLNVPITLVITLALGAMADRRRLLSPVYEVLFSLPMAISMACAALIFKVLLNPTAGYVNHLLHLRLGWYEDRNTAFWGILMMTVWMGIGLNYLLFLAAFRNVPGDVQECARLDGANELRIFFCIRLPLIAPTVCYVACTNMIQALMTSGPVLILTQGGPARSTTTLIYLMYTSGYASSNYSLAACVSLVSFALTMVITILLYSVQNRKEAAR